MTERHKIWIEQCDAAEGIEEKFGTQQALEYLVGEKFEVSLFVSRIRTIFERWQLAAYLDLARELEPFDPTLFEGDDDFDAEDIEDMRKEDIRHCTRDLLLVERARDWLLEDAQS